jgi:hypothetical protein
MEAMKKWLPLTLLLSLAALALVTAAAPIEKTLGSNARLVYLHGAWVWTAMVLFLAAAAAGLAGLALRKEILHLWSRSLGRTALLLWITFLPQSMYLMQANWNGLFLDEPRFRTPLNLAVVGLLLQMGISFFPIRHTSLANLLYAAGMFWTMNGLQTVLHPEGPIQNSTSANIQISFFLMLVLMIAVSLQISYAWLKKDRPHPKGIPVHEPGG